MEHNEQWLQWAVELQALAQAGLTYGKDLKGACDIGAHLAASVIVTTESVCPRFLPRELGLDVDVED